MSESKHVWPFDALIPAAPRRIRDWIPYLSALTQDPRYRAEAVSIVEEKSGYKRKSLLRELELHTPVSLRGSLKCVLTPWTEQLAVAMCELNSLADMPFGFENVKVIIEQLAQREVSNHVVRNFLKRNASSLTYKHGKMLSPSRVANNIVVETERFIQAWGELVENNRILKFNVIVFDETVVGDPTKLGKVIACKGKGAARVCCVHEKQLCVQVPFSSNDGSTLLIAYIFKKKKGEDRSKDCVMVRLPQTHGERNQPERRYFVTETGYLNTEVFKKILNEFLDIWNLVHPGVECFFAV